MGAPAISVTGTGFHNHILRVLAAELRGVEPAAAVRAQVSLAGNTVHIGRQSYELGPSGRVIAVGAGKAGAPMAAALAQILGHRLSAGLVIVKRGHTGASGSWDVRFGSGATGAIRLVEAGHPVPDAAGRAGAETIVSLPRGLSEADLVIALISGGGSALMPLPVAGLSLADLQQATDPMLRSGASIREINAVRKHCSRLQGGQLVRLAAPARVATLIVSDVVGNPLDAIASGPTAPDPTTYAGALAVLEHYGLLGQAPESVRFHLERGARGALPETPRPGDPIFAGVQHLVLADNLAAARAAVVQARQAGWNSELLTTYLEGEAREIGRAMAELAQGMAAGASDIRPPACLVLGGETTVTGRGTGRGGRNQELALAAAIALDGYPRLPDGVEAAVVTLATDGGDGPTDASGAIATSATVTCGRALGLDAQAALAANDSYPYFSALGDLVFTGPTNANVNDLVLVLTV